MARNAVSRTQLNPLSQTRLLLSLKIQHNQVTDYRLESSAACHLYKFVLQAAKNWTTTYKYVTRTSRYVLPTAHYLGDQIMEKMGWACSTNGGDGRWYRKLAVSGGPEGKTLFGKHVYRWNYNIKMDLKQDGSVWNWLSWFKIGISEWLVWTR